MTLQASGGMTIADINTEMGRASGAALDTTDTAMLDMIEKTAGSSIVIPDDFYGKEYLGTLYGTYTVTIGDNGPSYWGYYDLLTIGSISSTTYRSQDLELVASYPANPSDYPFWIILNATGLSSSLITAVRIVEDDLNYTSPVFSDTGSVCRWKFGSLNTAGPWNAANIGETRTVKIYA